MQRKKSVESTRTRVNLKLRDNKSTLKNNSDVTAVLKCIPLGVW